MVQPHRLGLGGAAGGAVVAEPDRAPPAVSQPSRSSVYVAMRDGVRLAVDVWRAPDAEGPCPCLLLSTRYWRALDLVDGDVTRQGTYPLASDFTGHGYAVVNVDS